jgi:hypothetical protein
MGLQVGATRATSRSSKTGTLLLANQIPAAGRTHLGGVHGTGRNIAALSHTVHVRLAALGQRHFAAEDDVRGFGGVRVSE